MNTFIGSLRDTNKYLKERIFLNRYYFIKESRRKATLLQFCLALIGIYCYQTTRDLTTFSFVFSLRLRFQLDLSFLVSLVMYSFFSSSCSPPLSLSFSLSLSLSLSLSVYLTLSYISASVFSGRSSLTSLPL